LTLAWFIRRLSAVAGYFAYILQCADETFYYGHTGDLTERLKANADGRVRYTRSRRPVRLVWFHVVPTRWEARKRERKLKQWRQRRRVGALITKMPAGAIAAFEGTAFEHAACRDGSRSRPYKDL
jgi:predicted GIY-YIG superfamily endonuclease